MVYNENLKQQRHTDGGAQRRAFISGHGLEALILLSRCNIIEKNGVDILNKKDRAVILEVRTLMKVIAKDALEIFNDEDFQRIHARYYGIKRKQRQSKPTFHMAIAGCPHYLQVSVSDQLQASKSKLFVLLEVLLEDRFVNTSSTEATQSFHTEKAKNKAEHKEKRIQKVNNNLSLQERLQCAKENAKNEWSLFENKKSNVTRKSRNEGEYEKILELERQKKRQGIFKEVGSLELRDFDVVDFVREYISYGSGTEPDDEVRDFEPTENEIQRR
eukprot:10651746-Ditylum_brightwellii.AAC.1